MSEYHAYKGTEAIRINGIFYGIIFLAGMAIYNACNFLFPLGMVFVLCLAGIGMGYWYITDVSNYIISEIYDCDKKLAAMNTMAHTGQILTFVCAIASWGLWSILMLAHYLQNSNIIYISDSARWSMATIGVIGVLIGAAHLCVFFFRILTLQKQ